MGDDQSIDPERAACLRDAKRIEEDATYTAKSHYNDADWWGTVHTSIGVVAAVLSVVAGVAALSEFAGHVFVGAVAAFTVAALTSIATFLNPSEKAASHHRAGSGFNALKDAARQTAELSSARDSVQKLRSEVRTLADRKAELNESSPSVRPASYAKARAGIERGEASYAVDAEG